MTNSLTVLTTYLWDDFADEGYILAFCAGAECRYPDNPHMTTVENHTEAAYWLFSMALAEKGISPENVTVHAHRATGGGFYRFTFDL